MTQHLVLEEIFDIDNYYKLCSAQGLSKDQKNLLRKYKKYSRDGNKVLIEYDFGKNWNVLKFGDYYPVKGIGLACFGREIRACLAQKYYWDLDIVNAHPSIIQNFCRERGWVCPTLDRFIDQRSEIIASICQEYNQARWWAKEECIKVFNGGVSGVSPILLELIPEIAKIRDNVVLLYPEIYKKACSLKVGDPKVTTLSLVFQEQTKKLLDCVSEYMRSNNRTLDVRIHDGGLIRKLPNEVAFPDDLLIGCQKYILKNCGYEISFEVKPLVHTFEFKDDDEYISADILIDDGYACEKFVELVDIRKVGGEIFIYNPATKRYDNDVKQQIVNNKKQLQFKQKIENVVRIFDYGGSSKNIHNLLALLPQHIKEGEVPYVFQYSLCEESYPERDEEILRAYKSLVDLCANGVEERAMYDNGYYAHILQKPYELPRVAMTYSGIEGAGKDTKINFLIKWVVGENNCSRYSGRVEQLFEKHDIGRMNALIVKVEEAKRSVCVQNQDTLKAFITSTTSDFNPKNVKEKIVVPNYNRIVFTTNYGCPIPTTVNDRRIALFDVSSDKVKDREFWNWIYKTLDNAYAGKVIGNYLASLDLSSYDPVALFTTDMKEVLQEESIALEVRFISDEEVKSEWTEWLSAGEIFTIYKAWCVKMKVGDYAAVNPISLGKKLVIPLRDKLIIRKVLHGHSLYKIPEGGCLVE